MFKVQRYMERDGFGQEYGKPKWAVESEDECIADNLMQENAKLICDALNAQLSTEPEESE